MKTIKNLTLAVVALVAMTSCCCKEQGPKFDAKKYAEHKTERIDQVVELSDAQEKEVYALFLEQGKEIKKNIKNFKKECGGKPECTKGECKKAEGCKKAECNKAKCDKPECCKAECTKGECKKAECTKGECKKAECTKGECKKAECTKGECKKAEGCKKAECDKAKCDKPECCKAECTKGECKKAEGCKKAECDKPKCDNKKMGRRPHHPGINPELMKATHTKLAEILTPEQMELLKAHREQRFQCAPNAQCCPTEK